MLTESAVLTVVEDGIMTITINRPSKRNAINREVSEGIATALDRLDGDSSIRVAMLTGAGDHFCAGMDLAAFARGENVRSEKRGFGGIVESPPMKPLIAAVEGWALGGGFEILLCCDIVVAGSTARFGLPETTRGLVARAGGAMRIARMLPRSIAMEMLLVGEPMDAARASHFGLVNHVVEPGTARELAYEIARKVSRNAPLATAASKRIVDESAQWPTDQAFALQAKILDPVFESEDAREGARAFAEKRTPLWRGR